MNNNRPQEQLIDISKILLDDDNPRLGIELDLMRESQTIDQTDISDSLDHPGYKNLKKSIIAIGYIEEPIKLYKKEGIEKYTVFEGNTRLKICRELLKNCEENGAAIEEIKKWRTIPAKVYDEINIKDMRVIRGMIHILGADSWGPFERAKEMYEMHESGSSITQMANNFGKTESVILKSIKTYQAMIGLRGYIENKHKNITYLEFMNDKFSLFDIFISNERVKEAMVNHDYNLEDVIDWLVDDRFKNQQHARNFDKVLNNAKCKERFLNDEHPSGASEQAIALLPTNQDLLLESTDLITLIQTTSDKLVDINNHTQDWAHNVDALEAAIEVLRDNLNSTSRLIGELRTP